jgi:murein L,D-transpeptidase YafK
MDIDLDSKYDELFRIHGQDFSDEQEELVDQMISEIDNYIRQIDPDFEESNGIFSEDEDIDWEW